MIAPYKRTPEAPRVALLTPEGHVVDEGGTRRHFDRWPDELRCWCDYDTARQLIMDGYGEALCWNGEEITWRDKRYDREGWKRRPTDVHVIKLPFYEEHELTVRALVGWRDWLAGFGASPTSTTGSAAWSLLRARLDRPLWTNMGDAPPLRSTLGGRQQLGPAGQGEFDGDLAQLDLPAAYASELGHLHYGGHWFRNSTLPRVAQHEPAWWAAQGRPVFVRAFVNVPTDLMFGPLPRRLRKPLRGFAAAMIGAEYPTGRRLQGVWTWQELEAAQRWGTRIVRIADTWVHLAGERQPFLPWWRAVEQGREMRGLAGLLAKTTGNALWGRFAMDSKAHGQRSIRSRSKSGRVVARPFVFKGGRPPAHDLAETVSGRIRSKLYDAMMTSGDLLLSAHTDGIWSYADAELMAALPEWRRKQDARIIELLDPQVLRYYPKRGRAQVVFAGVPSKQADEMFDAAWSRKFPRQTALEVV